MATDNLDSINSQQRAASSRIKTSSSYFKIGRQAARQRPELEDTCRGAQLRLLSPTPPSMPALLGPTLPPHRLRRASLLLRTLCRASLLPGCLRRLALRLVARPSSLLALPAAVLGLQRRAGGRRQGKPRGRLWAGRGNADAGSHAGRTHTLQYCCADPSAPHLLAARADGERHGIPLAAGAGVVFLCL